MWKDYRIVRRTNFAIVLCVASTCTHLDGLVCLDVSRFVMNAIAIQERYMKITKRYLILTGIWSDQSKRSKCISRYVIYSITIPCLMAQLAKVICFFSLNVLIEQVSFLLTLLLALIKQGTYIIKEKQFKALLHGMFNDWETAKSKQEFTLMTSYMQRGAFFGSIYIANAYICTSLFIQMPWWPITADILMPLNSSRARMYIFQTYYFIDEEKYYYLTIAHTSVATLMAMFLYIACDTSYIYVVQHTCGLLAVAGHRFSQAIEEIFEKKKMTNSLNEEYRKVCFSIQGHKRAITYLKEIEEIHCGYLFCCMGIMTATFSGTLVVVSKMEIGMQFYQYSSFLVVQLMHMFFLTLQGQFVINSTDEMYNKIYEGLWYNAVPKTQALYILALARTKVSPVITAGGLITLNLQSFADIIKTSFSYFTVLRST